MVPVDPDFRRPARPPRPPHFKPAAIAAGRRRAIAPTPDPARRFATSDVCFFGGPDCIRAWCAVRRRSSSSCHLARLSLEFPVNRARNARHSRFRWLAANMAVVGPRAVFPFVNRPDEPAPGAAIPSSAGRWLVVVRPSTCIRRRADRGCAAVRFSVRQPGLRCLPSLNRATRVQRRRPRPSFACWSA